MFESHPQAVLDFLRTQVSGEAARSLADAHARTGRPPAALALESGLLTPSRLFAAVAQHCQCGWIEGIPPAPEPAAVLRLGATRARALDAVPFRLTGEMLEVLVADPFRPHLLADLTRATAMTVRLMLAEPAQVAELLAQAYAAPAAAAIPLAAATAMPAARPVLDAAGVTAWVDGLLLRAVRERASDLHFEPFESHFAVRLRVEGTLRTVETHDPALAVPATSRLKVLADLNIAERRVPQDGRLRITADGRAVDLRISTLPTHFGESVVLRVLDGERSRPGLEELGLPEPIRSEFRAMVERPGGLVLVTGPTGSGKTTTLYGALRFLNTTDRKIVTVEDPVEYELPGVMQVGVNASIGRTFATTLRALLRQDPDVLLVGEIRDEETARVAVQAALTGHLVLATLHTNDAAGAVVRLVDMGVEPYLIASALSGVLAQRLLRRLCPDCCRPDRVTAVELRRLAEETDTAPPPSCHRAEGCASCHGTGYRGRCAVYEWLPVDARLGELVASGAPTQVLRDHARAAGRRSLRAAALEALASGETSVEDVLMYT